jgi:hypothetical protein
MAVTAAQSSSHSSQHRQLCARLACSPRAVQGILDGLQSMAYLGVGAHVAASRQRPVGDAHGGLVERAGTRFLFCMLPSSILCEARQAEYSVTQVLYVSIL